MQDYRLSVDETQSINQAMESRMQELDKAMSQVGKLVSQADKPPAYTMTAPAGEVTVRHFRDHPRGRRELHSRGHDVR